MNALRILCLASITLAMAATTGAQARLYPLGHEYSQLTRDDFRLLEKEVGTLLETGKPGSVASWRNDKSGNYGTMELEWSFQNEGIPCRRVDHVIRFKGESDPRLFQFTYCKTGQGWKLAE